MKNYRLLLALLLVPATMTMFSCTKNNNTTVVKTDSVYYSSWKELNMAATDGGDTLFFEDFNNTAITLDIINKGAILGYFAYIPQQGDTVLLPASDALGQFFDVGVIEVQSAQQFLTGQGFLYRYVLVPGTVSINSVTGTPKTYTVDDLKKMTYKQVMSLLTAAGASSKLVN